MNRRGFTLLELVLAVALGTVIVGVAWGLMMSVDRADRAIEATATETAQLERARLVASRMAASILMAPGSDPRKLATPGGESTDDKSRPRRRSRTGINPDDPLPTPRIMLQPDLLAGGVMTPARTVLDGELLSGRLVPAGEFGTGVVPQRLEIVLVDPPVPMTIDTFEAARRVLRRNAARGSAREEAGDVAETAPEAEASEEAEPDVAVRAFRGVFQLRPQAYSDEEMRRLAQGEAIRPKWQLEWQALMPRGSFPQDGVPPEAILDGTPRVIAQDLTYANWVFFDNGERKTAFDGTWGSDLPAYVELELETARGVQVNWMFEIGWAFGPEVPPTAPDTSRIGKDASGASPDGGGKDAGGNSPTPPTNGERPSDGGKAASPRGGGK